MQICNSVFWKLPNTPKIQNLKLNHSKTTLNCFKMLWTKRCMGLARAWKLVISNLNVTFLAHVNWINGSIVFSLWKIGSVANCWHTLYTLEAKWTSEFLHKELVVHFIITIERSPSSQFPFVWAFFLFKMFVYLLTLLMTFVCWWPFSLNSRRKTALLVRCTYIKSKHVVLILLVWFWESITFINSISETHQR